MNPSFRIGGHTVGLDHPTYFIADISANHDGDLGRAKDLVYLCAEAGADAATISAEKLRTDEVGAPLHTEPEKRRREPVA
mgnify:CR=1 FL=1